MITVVNYLIILIVVMIVACSLGYIRREKKRGSKCVGCPYSGSCGGNCSGKGK